MRQAMASATSCTAADHDPSSASSLEELPNNVLDTIFRFCDIRPISCVCKRWRVVFAYSHHALPPLKLEGPLCISWIEQYAKRLVQLTLRRVDDLSWIVTCAQLQSLWLVDCRRLDDLSPLAALPSLSVLTLTSCRAARDLSPLLHIQQLSALTLDSCFARDLSPLAGHQTLQDLHLAYDCWSVMSLKLPSSLPSLRRMRIMSSIYDLSPLACFTGLEELEVYAVSVCDLSPLSHLTNLQELDLHTLQEEQLLADMMTPLAALSSLKSLGLQGSDASIVEVTPWHRLTGLTRVDLHGSCVSDLRPLQVVSGLQALDLTEGRELVELSPLTALLHLRELLLTGCRKVRDLRPALHIKAAGGSLRMP